MLELEDWSKQLAQLWNQRFDALDELIKVEKEKTQQTIRKDV
jgi:hypothetical protein